MKLLKLAAKSIFVFYAIIAMILLCTILFFNGLFILI